MTGDEIQVSQKWTRSNKWKKEIKNEHKRMVTNGLWEPLDKKDLPDGVKVITSTWPCKKKNNGIYHGQLNVRGFKQITGKHFNPTSTAAPVANDNYQNCTGTYAVGRLVGKNIYHKK